MHVFIPWWIFAIAPFVAGVIAAASVRGPSSWYDIGTAILQQVLLLGGLLATVCIFIGHYI